MLGETVPAIFCLENSIIRQSVDGSLHLVCSALVSADQFGYTIDTVDECRASPRPSKLQANRDDLPHQRHPACLPQLGNLANAEGFP